MKDHQIAELVNNINKRVRAVFHDAPHQLREIIRTVVVEYFHVNDCERSFGGTLVTHKGQSLDQIKMDNTLLPCPLCNGKARITKGDAMFTVSCIACQLETDCYETCETVATVWNTRVPTERPAPCQHYCEAAAFNIKIRNLKSLISDVIEKFRQYEMDVDDTAPESYRRFMARLETAAGNNPSEPNTAIANKI